MNTVTVASAVACGVGFAIHKGARCSVGGEKTFAGGGEGLGRRWGVSGRWKGRKQEAFTQPARQKLSLPVVDSACGRPRVLGRRGRKLRQDEVVRVHCLHREASRVAVRDWEYVFSPDLWVPDPGRCRCRFEVWEYLGHGFGYGSGDAGGRGGLLMSSLVLCSIPTPAAADNFADHVETCRSCHQSAARCLNAEVESDAEHLPIPATIAEHQTWTPPKRKYSPEMELFRSHLRICKPCRRVADACGVTISKYLGPYSKHIETCPLCRASTRECIGVTTEQKARNHGHQGHPVANIPAHDRSAMEMEAQGFTETFRTPVLLLLAYAFAVVEYEFVAFAIGALATFFAYSAYYILQARTNFVSMNVSIGPWRIPETDPTVDYPDPDPDPTVTRERHLPHSTTTLYGDEDVTARAPKCVLLQPNWPPTLIDRLEKVRTGHIIEPNPRTSHIFLSKMHPTMPVLVVPRSKTRQGSPAPVSPEVLVPHLNRCFTCRLSMVACGVPVSGPGGEYVEHVEGCDRCQYSTAQCLDTETESEVERTPLTIVAGSRLAPEIGYSPQMDHYRAHLRACKPCRRVADACGVTISKYLGPYAKHIEACLECRKSVKTCMLATAENDTTKFAKAETSGKKSAIPARGFRRMIRTPILFAIAITFVALEYKFVAFVIGALALLL
ncbi:hypothetical protein DFP72DRAFT_846023 [Ephemerocybe angulata]|uniref:Uncharacterized protein n=1 Tax=Ephemerocybe angulata TaxID=980116 RepID=A0A8H6I4B0_9AGAR|nr:hypothetical protein DFP72DRAFT_846023 [Tulosesus angulatus]